MPTISDVQTLELWNATTGVRQQTVDLEAFARNLCFYEDDQYLNPNGAAFHLKQGMLSIVNGSKLAYYPRITVQECWVVRGSQKQLWLPPAVGTF